MTERETRAQELRRLVGEYRSGAGSKQQEAWNLIADFTLENYVDICAALRRVDCGEDAEQAGETK